MENIDNLKKILMTFEQRITYIVHYFDKVVISDSVEELLINIDRIIEIHIFDGLFYVYGVTDGEILNFFKPIHINEKSSWKDQKYKLHSRFLVNSNFNRILETRTFFDYDENLQAYEAMKMIVGIMEVSDVE